MSYGIESIEIHKKLKLDKRKGSDFWYARLTLRNGKRVVKSTKTSNFEEAKETALQLYFETQARIKNNLPAVTRKFKDAAKFAIERMQAHIAAGVGKQSYNDYISALNGYLIPYFGATDVDKIDLAGLTAFDAWREKKLGRKLAQSTINNHNAALNRVLDEAELHGWIYKSLRPTLLNKGVPTQSRGGFTFEEYKKIYVALRTWHRKTNDTKARDTRETLRNYVLFLANTGVRHGTEALGIKWKNLAWHEDETGKYLAIYVDGKANDRFAIARLRTEDYLLRQLKMNPNITSQTIDEAREKHGDEHVWITRMGRLATIYNLGANFNPLLEKLNMKKGADNAPRTLYSWRSFYQTIDLTRGMSIHKLSKQVGTSTKMMDKHYSKVSPLANAYEHSGKAWLDQQQASKAAKVAKVAKATALPSNSPATLAFKMLSTGKLTHQTLLAAIGVGRDSYTVTDELTSLALEARNADLIDDETLLKILNG